MKECPYDPGGYFVVKGVEKVSMGAAYWNPTTNSQYIAPPRGFGFALSLFKELNQLKMRTCM